MFYTPSQDPIVTEDITDASSSADEDGLSTDMPLAAAAATMVTESLNIDVADDQIPDCIPDEILAEVATL